MKIPIVCGVIERRLLLNYHVDPAVLARQLPPPFRPQLHGGWGVVHGHPIECLYRDIRALRIYEGASEVQKVIIARQTLAQEMT